MFFLFYPLYNGLRQGGHPTPGNRFDDRTLAARGERFAV